MKRCLWFLLLMLWSTPLLCLADELAVQRETLDLGRLSSGRPGIVELWFPKGRCTRPTSRYCLAESAVTRKVVFFSPGAMGSAGEYAWLGESLAAAGLVVIGVNHFGESRVYGAGTQSLRSSALLWQRPQDISALLDRLATERLFQTPVEWNTVIAIGHSAGGQTAAMLAGARFDLHRLADYCTSEAARGDRSCNYGGDRAQAPERFVELFNGQYRDARVRKLVLLDPALGAAAQRESLRSIRLPSLIVGATHNDFLPWKHQGQPYASGIPDADTLLLSGQEGHFVFLSPCTHSTRVMGVPLCEDRPGVDRREVQKELAREIVAFSLKDNEPANVSTQDRPNYATQSGGLYDILLYTPRWVFYLLAGLCALGLFQTRTRRVPVLVSLILPAAMLLLSLSGVVRYAGLQLPALGFWLAGLAASTALCLKLIGSDAARHDAVTRRLIIQGSWIPLLVILGIFFTRYFLGVASAMQSSVMQTWYFPAVVSLVLGAWSGYFSARGIVFWRAARA